MRDGVRVDVALQRLAAKNTGRANGVRRKCAHLERCNILVDEVKRT